VIPEQSSSLLMETVAFLNGGMRMSQRPRSSRPAFPPSGGPQPVLPAAEAMSSGVRRLGRAPAGRSRTQGSDPSTEPDDPWVHPEEPSVRLNSRDSRPGDPEATPKCKVGELFRSAEQWWPGPASVDVTRYIGPKADRIPGHRRHRTTRSLQPPFLTSTDAVNRCFFGVYYREA
jgi:hypothetical protein